MWALPYTARKKTNLRIGPATSLPLLPSLTKLIAWQSNCQSQSLILHRLPSFSKDIVDELGHRLGAAVVAPVSSTVFVVHHYPANEASKKVDDVLVALSCRHLLEVAVVLLRQASAFLLVHLSGMAQVLLVSHQAHWNLHLSDWEGDSLPA